MMGPEAQIERTIRKEAIREGWLVRKVTFPGTRGAPDRLFGKDRRCLLIEFKRMHGAGTIQQIRRWRELRETFGLEVHLCDSVELGRKILGLKGEG